MAREILNPYERALKNPTSHVAAIRAKCWDCEGRGADPGWQQRVRDCVVQDCPLRHVRPYRGRGPLPDEFAPGEVDYRGPTEQERHSGNGAEVAVGMGGRQS